MAEEMTNQSTSETNTGDDFLSDELGDASSNEQQESSQQTENSENSAPESFLKIRYNGADKELTQEEAVTLAQKGMNYDKINNKLQELQNSPALKAVTDLANRAGMPVEEYVTRLQQFNEQAAINEIASDFKAQNPDATDEMAEQYAKMAYQNQQYQAQAQAQQKSQAEKEAENNKLIQEVQAFQERYPDVKVEDLPNEVIDDINSGTPLETAYDRFLIRQLQDKISNKETNAKNSDNSVGKLSSNSSNDNVDPFIQGLLG